QIFGYAADEAIGKGIRLIIPPSCWEEHERHHAALLRSQEQDGQPILAPNREVVGRRKDGTTFPMALDVMELRIQDRSLFTAIIRDITERKRAEGALRESERRFRGIFDNTFQLMALLTPEGTVREANRRALEFTGLGGEEVQGRFGWDSLWFGHAPEPRDRFRKAVLEAAQGRFVRYEDTVTNAPGAKLTVDTSLTPIRDETGRVVFLIAEARDISERKRAERALR